MGWQQYSRPLWLSRANHYILYLKAITAQMPTCGMGFPQPSFSRCFWRPSVFRPAGARHSQHLLPTACAVGCILSPLRGLLPVLRPWTRFPIESVSFSTKCAAELCSAWAGEDARPYTSNGIRSFAAVRPRPWSGVTLDV
jgi:hypothetical protein